MKRGSAHSRFSTHGKYLSLGCVGYSVECLYLRDSFPPGFGSP